MLRDLPPLREVVARYGIAPRRSRGQHFLFDPAITDRIARAAGDLRRCVTYEVGPGPGGLTRSLLDAGARKIVAVESDSRCVTALEDLIRISSGRLRVIAMDALDVHERHYLPQGTKIVANLPYNAGTALLIKWLRDPARYASMTLMFQKEVAERLTAPSGGGDYGRLSVMAQWLCEVRRLFDVAPGSFVPPPKVVSTVVSLIPRSVPLAPAKLEHLERVTAAGFGQRRKMLRTSLKTLLVNTDQLLEAASVNPGARAEDLDVREFCGLARAYQAMLGGR